jgi:type IV secretion system protein VirD4
MWDGRDHSSAHYRGHRPGGEWDEVVGVGVIVVIGAVAGVLVIGHLSALMFDRAWPSYGLADVPRVLGGVLAEPGDPGRAWDPVNTGGRPPGPVAFWGTGLVVVAAGVGGWLAATRAPSPARSSDDGLEWAKRSQWRRLRVHRPGQARIVVGRGGSRLDRALVAAEERHSVLVIGTTQSGKTSGLAVPAILDWPGPVVATSTKGDLVDDTAGWRAHQGRVQVFDPADVTAYPGSSWTPMANSVTWEGAMADAAGLAKAGLMIAGRDLRMGKLWFDGAQKLLGPYLYAAGRSGRTITDVARWIDAEDFDTVRDLLGDCPDAVLAHESTFRRRDDSRSDLFQIAQQILGVYLDPVVARSADRSDIVAEELFDGGAHTFFVTAPDKDQDRFEAVFSTIIRQFFDAADTAAARNGGRLKAPLLVVLDEAANIAPLHGLDQIVSTASSKRVSVMTICQDLAQLEDRYATKSRTIINNHRGLVLLPGNKDTDTLNLAAQLAGDHSIDRSTVTRNHAGPHSTSTGAEWRPLLPAARGRTLGANQGVLVYFNLPPIRFRQRPWYRDRRLRRLSLIHI